MCFVLHVKTLVKNHEQAGRGGMMVVDAVSRRTGVCSVENTHSLAFSTRGVPHNRGVCVCVCFLVLLSASTCWELGEVENYAYDIYMVLFKNHRFVFEQIYS